MELKLIVEYLEYSGQLTRTREADYDDFQHDKDGFHIKNWKFSEKLLSVSELEAISQTAEFQSYISNRDEILKKKQANDAVDNQPDVERAKKRAYLRLFNELRVKMGFAELIEDEFDGIVKEEIGGL